MLQPFRKLLTAPPPEIPQQRRVLGRFRLTSTWLHLADPAAVAGGDISYLARSGLWVASVAPVDAEARSLEVSHVDARGLTWVTDEASIVIDSGMVGMFDHVHFKDDQMVPRAYRRFPVRPPGDAWVEYFATGLTEDTKVHPFGVVARVGVRAGCFRCVIARDEGSKIVGARLAFPAPSRSLDSAPSLGSARDDSLLP